jgi:hypothetical protein
MNKLKYLRVFNFELSLHGGDFAGGTDMPVKPNEEAGIDDSPRQHSC